MRYRKKFFGLYLGLALLVLIVLIIIANMTGQRPVFTSPEEVKDASFWMERSIIFFGILVLGAIAYLLSRREKA